MAIERGKKREFFSIESKNDNGDKIYASFHTLQEAKLFEKALRNSLDYPVDHARMVHVVETELWGSG